MRFLFFDIFVMFVSADSKITQILLNRVSAFCKLFTEGLLLPGKDGPERWRDPPGTKIKEEDHYEQPYPCNR